MKLIPLGTNGFFSFNNRYTASYLLLINDFTALILDAGTGFARLLDPAVQQLLVGKELFVILSHFHLDHMVGLSFLTGVLPDRDVTVYAPGPPLVQAAPTEALAGLLNPPLYSLKLDVLPLQIRSITKDFRINNIEIRVRAQKHPGGSIGIRIGNFVAYITDTIADRETIPFVKGVDVLLHEVWLTDREAMEAREADGVFAREKHSWAGAVAEIASEAGVKALAPIHHPPWRSEKEIFNLISNLPGTFTPLVLKEGQVYDLAFFQQTGKGSNQYLYG
ncbi:MAG: MBL fold metallo-hydrolase [Bacillota bacterium]